MSGGPSVGLLCAKADRDVVRQHAESQGMVVIWTAFSRAGTTTRLACSPPQVLLVTHRLIDVARSALRNIAEPSPVLVICPAAVRLEGANHQATDAPDELSTGKQAVRISEELIVAAAHDALGRVGVKEAQKALRSEMFREALRQSNGNRHATARVLKVDRRYVLKMLKEDPDLES